MSIFENQTGRIPRQSILHQRYAIVGPLGRGGMSAVYQAVDTQEANRRVAIKEMSQGHLSGPDLDEAIRRFQQEATLLHSLRHPNLPRIFDIFEEQGRSYLVMEFIEGKNLFQLLQENKMRPLPVAQVVDYALQLCDVLIYLHGLQPPIIFRDLKPTNVMVTGDGHIYLIDFGIARFFKEGQQQDTILLGSPGYAPPEQHGSGQTNPRSDLYSLGATLHCCLTGKDPYLSTERFIFTPVRQVNPQVPLELDQLIQRLVIVDERYRPASALEVQQWLRQIRQQAAGDTVQVSPRPAAPAYAPTQNVPPNALSPASPHNTYQAPQLPPTVAVRTAAPSPQLPQRSARGHPQASAAGFRRKATWTAPFTTLFLGMLILTAGGTLYALNFIVNSDHMVEFGLSALLLLVAIGATLFVHKFVPLLILMVIALGSMASGIAFLMQATPGIQLIENLVHVSDNNLFTAGLGIAALVLLCWLFRSISWPGRLLLFVVSGAATICLFIQYPLSDANSLGGNEGDIKHTLLLTAIILLIQSTLLAVQAERARSHS
ncbi:MAG TPA: serine/threonine-protein kinase [Ktedonobacteraceae bacterium]|nr:serine/threonine-protein kinase [Ktedonobacteraceae bacterium]